MVQYIDMQYIYVYIYYGTFLAAQTVKNLPSMWETRFQFLGQEDPLEEIHGNPFQYSFLENPMDRGTWRVTIHEVAKSWT